MGTTPLLRVAALHSPYKEGSGTLPRVEHVLDTAPSGRAKCRGCGKPMAKGELRFGESVPNPFAEGTTHRWFHLPCAAFMRPEPFLPALDVFAGDVPEREFLRAAAQTSVAHRRLPRLLRAERASSGRARCRSCREPIAKDSFRFALQMFEEEALAAPIGFIHAACSEAYFGTREVLDRVARLSPEITGDELAELTRQLAQAPARLPSVAKAQPDEDERDPGSSAQSA
jgi:hypothetical protein